MSIKECLEAFVAHVQALKEEDEALEDGYTKEFQVGTDRDWTAEWRRLGLAAAATGPKATWQKQQHPNLGLG